MTTHGEFIEIVGLEKHNRCRAADMTFGGRCLNCGYNPETVGKMSKDEASKFYKENRAHLLNHFTF